MALRAIPQAAVECGRAAHQAGFPIACPTALPEGSSLFWTNGFAPGGGCESLGPTRLRRWTWMVGWFRYGARLGHVAVASIPRSVGPSALVYMIGTSRPHRSPRVTPLGSTTVREHFARYVHPAPVPGVNIPPPGGGQLFMGRTVLTWFEGGHTYAVGVDGPGLNAPALEAAVARGLMLVGPAS